ncbi:MAG: PAS domain-containing protein [Rhodospirillales bacterium]
MQTLDEILEAYPIRAFAELAAFWRRHAGDAIPRLHELDLMEIYRLMPVTVLVDLEGPLDGRHVYRWRLAGTEIRLLMGIEITGLTLGDVFPAESVVRTDGLYTDVLKTGRPHAWRHAVNTRNPERYFLEYDRLMLPLAGRDGTPAHLIGVYEFSFAPKPDQG